MMLENYNSCPRIAKKVRIMDEQEIKRTQLLEAFKQQHPEMDFSEAKILN